MKRLIALAAAVLAVASSASQSRAAVIVVTDRPTFNASTTGLSTITFEGLAPVNGFTFFNSPPGLTTMGVNFRATPGTNNLFVIDPNFSPPNFFFPSGQYLQNNNFGQFTGIDALLPPGTTAVGADVSAQFPPGGSFTATVTLSTGDVFAFTRPTRPSLSFLGFLSDTPITSVRFTASGGGTATTLDNVSVGQAVIPEPATFAVFGVLAASAFGLRRRMKGAAAVTP